MKLTYLKRALKILLGLILFPLLVIIGLAEILKGKGMLKEYEMESFVGHLIFVLIFLLLLIFNWNGLTEANAYQTETYNIDSTGNEVLQFNVPIPVKYDWRLPRQTWFTSYNPERGQTDNSPCIGAGLTDICEMAEQGIRTIALSQDMVGRAKWKEYHYGEKVMLFSDNPQCQGIWQVEDTLNKRYTNRGDLFQPTRATNTSCWVTVTKL